MNSSRPALSVLGGVIMALAVGIGFLFVYCKPAIEYAYVDIIEDRGSIPWRWIVIAWGSLALLIGGVLTWRFARRSKRR